MIRVRPHDQRGFRDLGWMRTHHSFSFGDYQDPGHVQFRSLVAVNEDVILPGQTSPTIQTRNMEIVTLVCEGSLEHENSIPGPVALANREDERSFLAGDFQCITAGRGVAMTDRNPSRFEPARRYQFWLYPNQQDLSAEQRRCSVSATLSHDRWQVIASNERDEQAMTIHQDVQISIARLNGGTELSKSIVGGRHVWLQVLRGQVSVMGQTLAAGDGASISGENQLVIQATQPSEVIAVDLS